MAMRPALWLKQVLPPEHGSWAYVLEPALIAGIVGGSAGWLVGLGVFLLFLAYRPLNLAMGDRLRGRSYPRTRPALVAGTALLLLGVCAVAGSGAWEIGVVLAACGLMFAWLDQKAPPRSVWRELAGALLAVPVAAYFVLPTHPPAVGLLFLRPLASVLSIRGAIGRFDDGPVCGRLGIGLGQLLVGVSFGLAWPRGIPPMLGVAYAVAGGRAVWLAGARQDNPSATRIGMAEAVISLGIVLAWAVAPLSR